MTAGRSPGEQAPADRLIDELARVISDPGSVLPRYMGGPAVAVESVARWSARAVVFSLPLLAQDAEMKAAS